MAWSCNASTTRSTRPRAARADAVLLQRDRRGRIGCESVFLLQLVQSCEEQAPRLFGSDRHARYRNSRTGIVQERIICVVVLPTSIVRNGLWP